MTVLGNLTSDPDPDVRNDPIPEPVREEPLPGEPPEPHSDPKPEEEA